MKKLLLLLLIPMLSVIPFRIHAQETFPVNGIPDKRINYYAFTNATIQFDYQTRIDSATLLIREGVIVEVGRGVKIPVDAAVIDLNGKWIYPSFIDPYTSYGIPEIAKSEPGKTVQLTSNTKGAYSWNQALKPETQGYRIFATNEDAAARYRKAGFGLVFTSQQDGIARGTGSVVSLASVPEQDAMIVEQAAACYSFKKGSSKQDYPTSEMGAIALIRQSFLDADWYKSGGKNKEHNISIQSWIDNQDIPQIFECDNYLQSMRADRVGDEFGVRYIIKGSGDEYKRAGEIKATGNDYILPLAFPESYDVSDPYEALNLSLSDLKHWETAPANAKILSDSGVVFAFTAAGLKDPSEFLEQLRKVVRYGLTPGQALRAVTEIPSAMLRLSDRAGSLRKGKLANFIITSGDLFKKETFIFENWIQGKPYVIRKPESADIRGVYRMTSPGFPEWQLKITGESFQPKAVVIQESDSSRGSVTFENNIFTLRFEQRKGDEKGWYVLSGYPAGTGDSRQFTGTGRAPSGKPVTWTITKTGNYVPENNPDTSKVEVPSWGSITYPALAFGFDTIPGKETTLIKNVTVWTNEKEGVLKNTDVLIDKGKISAIGRDLSSPGAKVIDGTGLHLTPGIIDEHSHIAVSGNVNECSHSVTSEVRIGDVLNPDDINIYRQLSGGVTTSQLLHGSCNPVGGQSAIIKLRWGQPAEKLKFEGAPGFIKFALGENVKQSNWGDENKYRYPQTRMGVEQVYVNAFTRAEEYEKEWKKYNPKSKDPKPRKDLRLDALVEIKNKKRFITCHSYQQGEINMLMHVADSMGFKINTFTHILEGYKVADKMKAHGVGASSFADWWAYKFEVIEAIPYNGAIMHDVGLTVAYNSDDAEMARRLNQEAAKAVKYGNLSEEEALKFVTLNPAKLLRIDNRVGSVKVGKDADVVLWSGNPLSVYSKVLKTFIDGTCYYDAERDKELQLTLATERDRLIKKMMEENKKGSPQDQKKPPYRKEILQHCTDEEQN